MISTCHFCDADGGGGAAQAAFRLHVALRALGVASSMLVGRKVTRDPDVAAVAPGSLAGRATVKLAERWQARRLHRYASTRSASLEIFTLGQGVLGRKLLRQLPAADVFTLHWSSRLIDYDVLFSALPWATPVVWRMPDMNAMTGGCHYTLGCEGFTGACGNCPQLGSSSARDLSRRVHERKRRAYAKLDPAFVRFVAPSRWLQRQAERSSLLAPFECVHIPTGVDTDVFRPHPRDFAREVLGLPAAGRVVLFGADSVANHRKGFDLLLAAIAGLAREREVTLAAIGGGHVEVPAGAGPVVPLGRIDDARLLALAYAAADLFVLPTRADNLPNVVLEAMACGTPVVGFDVGGVPDMVRPGETGLLAPPEDVAGLRDAIATLLEDDELRARLGAEAREVAVREYGMELMARRYLAVYEELVEAAARRSHTPRPGTRPRA